jgi:hypothetical protein
MGVDGLSLRGMGLNETEMSRCTNKPRRADTRFSIKCQHIVGGSNLSDAPASCVYATSCLKATDFAEMPDDMYESKTLCAASAMSTGFFPKT